MKAKYTEVEIVRENPAGKAPFKDLLVALFSV
jgi:hypothetical protein